MKISLTEMQIRQLTSFFDRVQATAALGRPGMLIAQVRWDTADQKYWMEPGFLPHEYAVSIQEKGQTCLPVPTPTDPATSTAHPNARSAPDAEAGMSGSVP